MPARSVLENERKHAHADEVRAVDALEALAITARTPRSLVPLAAQSRDEPVPYSRPANTTKGTLLRLITHGGVIDRETLTGRLQWMVKPPSTTLPVSSFTIWFLMRMLAKVPRIITSWLPRRVPYWLKSTGRT